MCWRGAAAPPRTEIEPGAGERVAPGLLRQVLLDAGRRAPDGGAPSLNLSQGQAPPRGPGSAAARAPLAPRPAEAGARWATCCAWTPPCRSRLAGPSNRPCVVEHLTYAIHMPVAGCAAAQSVSILTCSAHGATCCSMARSHRSFSCQVCNGWACVMCPARAPVPSMGGTAARRRARGWRRGRRAVPRAGTCGMVPLQRGEPHRAQRAAGLLQRQARRAGPGGARARAHPAPSAGAPHGAQAAWPAPAPALWRCARSERPWGPWGA